MGTEINRVDIWAASISDSCGSLACKFRSLAEVGIDIEFGIARRCHDIPGEAVAFVAGISGAEQERAAENAGFKETESLAALRVISDDRSGLGASVTECIAKAGINLRGFSGVKVGNKVVFHIAFDSNEDADKAMASLSEI
ncbi:MAG: amino acid-binding protein [Phycisphaerae bacterium]|nr:amino acid-binding protein [Phycisphaerae bacterium]